MQKITISKNGRKRLLNGHPWVFSSDIVTAQPGEPGEIVEIADAGGAFLAMGYYNPRSQISLRVLSREKEPIDRAFWQKRIRQAIDYRKKLGVLESCRLIHAESDLLPALIVDKFNDVLVLQSLSAGIEQVKETIADILMEELPLRGIYERSEAPVRAKEGLEIRSGFLRGHFDTDIVICENGVKLKIDVANGQKTGYFFDQRENRAAIAPFVKDGKVLDCFCHTGSFALHAAHYGAREALGIDISEEAVVRAREQAALNGFDQVSFEACNAFDKLKELHQNKELFDCVILDPPAFAKNRAALTNALRGYKEINLRGMHIVRPGGYLVSCSCSQHVSEDEFLQMLRGAAADANKTLRIVEARSQGKDHPFLLAAPETRYLKCIIMQVL